MSISYVSFCLLNDGPFVYEKERKGWTRQKKNLIRWTVNMSICMRYKVTTKHVVIFIYTVGYRDNLYEEELQFLAHSSEKNISTIFILTK